MEAAPELYYSYNRYLQETFKGKTYKVVVASGLTCPTRDGTLGKKGCAFCDVRGSSSYFGKQGRSLEISEQIQKRLPGIRERLQRQALPGLLSKLHQYLFGCGVPTRNL